MTEEQKKWLDAHPEYRPIGRAGGTGRWTARGTLKPDGTFVPVSVNHPLPGPGDKAFGVGKFETGTEPRPSRADDPALQTQRTAPGLRRGARRVDAPPPDAGDPPPRDPRDYISGWQGGGGGLPSQEQAATVEPSKKD